MTGVYAASRDDADSLESPLVMAPLRIDRTAPTLTCALAAPTFAQYAVQATVGAVAADTMSGPLSMALSASADTNTTGTKYVSFSATDVAGNVGSIECPYTVAPALPASMTLEFLDPIETDRLNVVRAGRVIPLKWRLQQAGVPVTTLASAGLTVRPIACTSGEVGQEISDVATGPGGGLQNLGDGYYQYNWRTAAGYKGSCQLLIVDVGDGVGHAVRFQFK